MIGVSNHYVPPHASTSNIRGQLCIIQMWKANSLGLWDKYYTCESSSRGIDCSILCIMPWKDDLFEMGFKCRHLSTPNVSTRYINGNEPGWSLGWASFFMPLAAYDSLSLRHAPAHGNFSFKRTFLWFFRLPTKLEIEISMLKIQ